MRIVRFDPKIQFEIAVIGIFIFTFSSGAVPVVNGSSNAGF